MRIALIGSNSFIAKEIFKSTLLKNNVFGLYGVSNDLNASGFVFFKYPEAELQLSDLLSFDVIIYCAGAGIQSNLNESTSLIYELNSFLPIKMFNFLIKEDFGGKIITFGSYFEIGENSADENYSEEDVVYSKNVVTNDYCISKRILSRFLTSLQDNLSLKWFHIYLPNIYNVSENPQRIIPYVINNIKAGVEMEFTEGRQVRQFLHTDDLIRFIELLIGNKNIAAGFYNLSPDEAYTIKDIVRLISHLMSVPFMAGNFGKKKGRDESMMVLKLDNCKAKNIGFQASIGIETGIKKYFEV